MSDDKIYLEKDFSETEEEVFIGPGFSLKKSGVRDAECELICVCDDPWQAKLVAAALNAFYPKESADGDDGFGFDWPKK
jgi:hypothetical protein